MYPAIVLLICFAFSVSLQAQTNQTDANGQRTGMWILADERQAVYAKGRYDAGQKQGQWRYYFSPIARKTQEPDVIGTYENGLPHGSWQCTESQTKISLKGSFQQGQMTGIWSFNDRQGNLLAKGKFDNGLRNGEWTIYHNNQPMAQGRYENGQKVGVWTYDYYPDKTVHVKASYDFTDGMKEGKQEWYKVDNHPKFAREEVLVGVGTFLGGKKTGKWIEYQRGYRGEVIEIGYYDGDGKRTGVWETTADGKPFQQATYSNGIKQGSFKSFFENGQVQYQTYFEGGLETGAFSYFYENGILRERGGHTIIEQERIDDTTYYKIDLPLEFFFRLVQEDFVGLNYYAANWLAEPDELLTDAASLEKRYQDYLQYARGGQLQIAKVNKSSRQVVRVGESVFYHENGKIRLKGQYIPQVSYVKDVMGNVSKEFAKDGLWEEFDDLGYLRKTYHYEKGKLVKILDDKGKEIN